MPLFYVIGLAVAGIFISSIGAWFSVTGLASLFSGAYTPVALMAAGLEFAKLVIVAYLHRAWYRTALIMRVYMSVSVAILSVITSMGVFGFLSNAYQKSSLELDTNMVKISAAENDAKTAASEIQRIQSLIAEVPTNRISKKISLEKEMKPRLDELAKRRDRSTEEFNQLKLLQLQTHTKVGPLIFVSKAFHTEIDNVVKYLITIFVTVFDPLAICLIIAFSASLTWREQDARARARAPRVVPAAEPEPVSEPVAEPGAESVAAPEPEAPAEPTAPDPSAPPFEAVMDYDESEGPDELEKAS